MATTLSSVRYIAGDIGGTNSRLQLLEIKMMTGRDGRVVCEEELVQEKNFPSRDWAHLKFIIAKFLEGFDRRNKQQWPQACCLAVAGPVKNNAAIITNLDWQLDGGEMSDFLSIPHFLLINDFVGAGYGLLALKPTDLHVINNQVAVPGAPIAIIGAGTGLGEAYLTLSGLEYTVFPSEGGHADFAPRNATENKLLEYIRESQHITRVSVERVVSGPGLLSCYNFFAKENPSVVSNKVELELRNAEQKGSVISKYGQNRTDALCEQAMDTFIRCYGAEAGNMALKFLPFGGLYIAGGIAAKNITCMHKDEQFLNAFLDKGRMTELLRKVPVSVVLHSQVGLLGSRVVCRRLLRRAGVLPEKDIDQKEVDSIHVREAGQASIFSSASMAATASSPSLSAAPSATVEASPSLIPSVALSPPDSNQASSSSSFSSLSSSSAVPSNMPATFSKPEAVKQSSPDASPLPTLPATATATKTVPPKFARLRSNTSVTCFASSGQPQSPESPVGPTPEKPHIKHKKSALRRAFEKSLPALFTAAACAIGTAIGIRLALAARTSSATATSAPRTQ